MATYYTPIANGAVANAATFNAPLAQIDAALVGGSGVLKIAQLGVGNTAPLALVHVGDRAVNNSTDAEILISRTIAAGSIASNSHGYSDSTNFANTGYAYNSYDARVNITGTGALDHYAAFQGGQEYNNSNTLPLMYSFFSRPTMTQGTITALYHAYAGDPTYVAGTITTQYGLYVENLTRGSTNYAIYTAGTTASLFGGAVTINGNPIVGATGTSPSLTVGNQTSNSTSSTFIQKGKSSGATALAMTWTLTTGATYTLDSQGVSNIISINSVTGDITYAGHANLASGKVYKINSTQVVGARNTGWTPQTATPAKTDLGASPTVGALAQWAAAIQAALTTHGLLGA